jgi:hypothetical protein
MISDLIKNALVFLIPVVVIAAVVADLPQPAIAPTQEYAIMD